jgi:hypothetical protein
MSRDLAPCRSEIAAVLAVSFAAWPSAMGGKDGRRSGPCSFRGGPRVPGRALPGRKGPRGTERGTAEPRGALPRRNEPPSASDPSGAGKPPHRPTQGDAT